MPATASRTRRTSARSSAPTYARRSSSTRALTRSLFAIWPAWLCPPSCQPMARDTIFESLHEVAKVVTRNLNRIIDINYYPVEEARRSNLRHRPIGLGVQGLADVFLMMRYPFDGPEARELNRQIFETIYHAALEASCDLAERDGPYETYPDSPVSKGELQYDMWGVTPTDLWDWNALKAKIAEHGVRNSLLVAPCQPRRPHRSLDTTNVSNRTPPTSTPAVFFPVSSRS